MLALSSRQGILQQQGAADTVTVTVTNTVTVAAGGEAKLANPQESLRLTGYNLCQTNHFVGINYTELTSPCATLLAACS
jgi:hypothetical protein